MKTKMEEIKKEDTKKEWARDVATLVMVLFAGVGVIMSFSWLLIWLVTPSDKELRLRRVEYDVREMQEKLNRLECETKDGVYIPEYSGYFIMFGVATSTASVCKKGEEELRIYNK